MFRKNKRNQKRDIYYSKYCAICINKNNQTMKNIKFYFLALLSVFVVTTARSQTADEVIEKYADAIGGRAAVTAVKTVKTTGSMNMMGMDFPFTMYASYPDKSFLEVNIQGMVMKQGCDGTNGWALNPMTGSQIPEKVDEETANSFKPRGRTYSVLLTYKDDGAKVELAGKDTLSGNEVFKLKYTGADGEDQYFYIDSGSGNLLRVDKKVKSMGKVIRSETTYSNFKKTGDIVMPYLIDVKTSESKMGNQTLVIDKIEINPEFEESIFTIPAK